MKDKMIIDAKNAILGRLSSYAAKQLLLGKDIAIVNCDDVLVSGKPLTTILEYREKRQKGSANFKGPFFPKSPERIVKRTIRGMLSHRQGRGKQALKKVMCYNNIPAEYAGLKMISAGKEKNTRTTKLKDIGREI